MSYTNLHMILKPDRSVSPTLWSCDYCGQKDTMEAMSSGGCTHEYPVCEHCGGCEDSNECRPDCSGIAAILASPDVYVAGAPEVEMAKAELRALKRKLEN